MRLTFHVIRIGIIGCLLVILGGVVGFRMGKGENVPLISKLASSIPQISRLTNIDVPGDKTAAVDFSQFWEVWNRVERDYVDPEEIDAEQMVYGAISGMVSAIGDPYTMYLPPDEQKRSVEDLNGSFDGVGIQLGYKNSTLVVVAPLKGLPAERAGVKAGDYILTIKDDAKSVNRDTAGITLPEAVSLIRGLKGTKVTLTLLREGGQPEDKTLVRDTIVIPSVELTFPEVNGKSVAHLVLSKFGDNTPKEWSNAVGQILQQRSSIRGIVLDLRNNPGGYLDEAVSVASEFIPDGVVVTQQGRYAKQTYSVNKKGLLVGIPVVVIINKGSASASEIVAGALRDRLDAKLVGENSFGKGTVQDAQSDLPGGAGLHITIAKWLLPSGEWIDEKGLPPSVEANTNPTEESDEALAKAVDVL